MSLITPNACRLLLLAFFHVLGLWLSSSSAQAAPVLDQLSYPGTNVVFDARFDDYQGQTFTVGLAGMLDSIKVDVQTINSPDVDVDFILAPIVNGIALYSQAHVVTIPSLQIPIYGAPPPVSDWLTLDFSGFNILVNPGDQFSLVSHSPITFIETSQPDAKRVMWFGYAPGLYLEGTPSDPGATLVDGPLFVRNDFDANFATFVNVTEVPEAPTSAIVLVGLALALLARSQLGRTLRT